MSFFASIKLRYIGMASRGVAQVKFGSSAGQSVLEALQVVATERPHAGHGQIVVRITARPINHSDLNTIRNSRFSSLASQGCKVVIGDEGCGVVEEVRYMCIFLFLCYFVYIVPFHPIHNLLIYHFCLCSSIFWSYVVVTNECCRESQLCYVSSFATSLC